jgi:hypothetical protein
VLKRLYRSHPFADHPGGLLQSQSSDDPKKHDVPLVIREGIQDPADLSDRQPAEGFLFGVAGRCHLHQSLELGRCGGFAASGTSLVRYAVVGDDEHPGAELLFVSGEAADSPHDLDEYLAGQVLGLGDAVQAKVPGDRGSQIPVQGAPGPLSPKLSGSQDFGKTLANCHLRKSPPTGK